MRLTRYEGVMGMLHVDIRVDDLIKVEMEREWSVVAGYLAIPTTVKQE